jgi:peroxiredoxin
MNRIKNNSLAVLFETTDYLDEIIKLKDFKGKRIYLSFFRDVYCPFCNIRLNQLINRFEEFENKGIKIITFFGSSKNQISEYAERQRAPFPIVPDPNLIIYKKYGVETSFKAKLQTIKNYKKVIGALKSEYFNLKSFTERNIVPADFLIDENLTIKKAYYGQDFSDHLPIKEILLNWK